MTTMNTEPGEQEETPGFKDWLNREDSGDVEQLQRCWNRAAARMRERCVQKVKEMRGLWNAVATEHLSEDEDNAFARSNQRECAKQVRVADRIITALESLTLDGEKEQ